MIFRRLHRLWLQSILFRSRIPYALWNKTINSSTVLSNLDQRGRHRLPKLASLFLHDKSISGAAGFKVDDEMRAYIAAMACLLILNLDLDYYKGWSEIIIYPDTFVIRREETDDIGVVHNTRRTLAGESWQRGPLILSWADSMSGAGAADIASNVILHEFAHKIDMLNGAANGMPPLHANMVREAWTTSLAQAFADMKKRIEQGDDIAIDSYAAEDPAEFFAVISEVFFEQPRQLYKNYHRVYQQLCLFYRQDPIQRVRDK